ncbi:hypothetical protein TcasGA2_TC032782 [Tribolium castaneum]|uniref:Uncharacterized protein n=1 Tax=Tribolium castaneum TaxID=7070 RepID=A0A139WJ29_TRICA|nr:PREDICTED: uncharacterized protein LOC100142255 [Tribolium castaneum]KYB27894.1 hypothetical protein TcasGA2_TC032782 [Tribolium castaneum]|eukprot:XP_015834422.1 PREDICTED: uncharacterized protein LOC100142255 [Tribolium castaneum]
MRLIQQLSLSYSPASAKMKLPLLVLASVTICCAIPATNLSIQTSVFKALFYKLIKEKCYANATDATFQQFINLSDNATECLKMKAEQAPILITPLKQFKENIQFCVEELVTQLEECLPEELKEWPQANIDVVFSVTDFFYENKDQLLTPKFRKFTEQCMENLDNTETRLEIAKCLTTDPLDTADMKTFCRGIDLTEKCCLEQLGKRCPADASIKKLEIKFFAAMKETCAEYETTESSTDNLLTLYPRLTPPNINPELM